ncbi:hypothetical protein MWG08_10020 [Fusobacterium necrophorum]|nr:hypothetical protein [Fusobacterium necrophorum]MDK4488281.1 hypothetical protein [Fusobacterium necrophorum]
MMWKCKECGSDDFIERVVGGYEKYSSYDKNGYSEGFEESDYEAIIECNNCGNYKDTSCNISNIADWIEEEENE